MQDFSVLSPPKPAPDTQILPAAVWGPSGQGRLAHEGGSRAVLVSHTGCRAGGRLARSPPSRASGSQLGVPLERRLPAPTACRPGVLTLLRGPWERPAGQTAPRVSPRCPRVLRGPPCPTLRVSGLGLPHGSPRRPLQWDLPAPDATASLRQQEKVCGAELPHVSRSRVRAAPFPGHLLRGLPALPSFRPGRGPVPFPSSPPGPAACLSSTSPQAFVLLGHRRVSGAGRAVVPGSVPFPGRGAPRWGRAPTERPGPRHLRGLRQGDSSPGDGTHVVLTSLRPRTSAGRGGGQECVLGCSWRTGVFQKACCAFAQECTPRNASAFPR